MMNERKAVLLLCANGASSRLLADKMKACLHEDEPWIIDARPFGELSFIVAKYDVVLIAPQIQYEENSIRKMTAPYEDIRIINIPSREFSSENAEAILNRIRQDSNQEEPAAPEKIVHNKLMDRFTASLEQYLLPFSVRLTQNKYLQIIRRSITVMIPIAMVGSFAFLITYPPVPETLAPTNFLFQFLLAWKSFSLTYHDLLITPYYMTIGIMSFYVLCTTTYQLAVQEETEIFPRVAVASILYLCVSHSLDLQTFTLDIAKLGADYMLSAILIAFLSNACMSWFTKLQQSLRSTHAAHVEYQSIISSLMPLLATIVLFLIMDQLIYVWTGFYFVEVIHNLFVPLIHVSGSLPSILFTSFLMTTLWFFGLHGNALLSGILYPITMAALSANAEAVIKGQVPEYIYAGTMQSVFGNWITYNAILFIILLFCRSHKIRSIAKASILPSLFNINEPIIFGLPTVLNVYAYIPLILCNIINTSTYYFLAKAGLLGKFYIIVPFSIPGPVQAWLGTGDVNAMYLWFGLFLLSIAISYPFIMVYDKTLVKEEEKEDACL